jgi:type I restriction-modification system DNA methylase subunit
MMVKCEQRQRVFALLSELDGLERLKELFRGELNYAPVNLLLSRQGWTAATSSALAEDPLIFAAGGVGDGFHVIYCRLGDDRLPLEHERAVVSRLFRGHPFALFIFSNVSQDRWRFINIKHDEDLSKRRLFRRITIGPEERIGNRLRAASERIKRLDLKSMKSRSRDLSPLDIQKRHDAAFDAEKVRHSFLKAFAVAYRAVADEIRLAQRQGERAGKLAHLILDRMLFLYFAQKRGWLDDDPDYLYSRFRETWRDDPQGHSFYSNVLAPLLKERLFEEVEPLEIKNSTFKFVFEDLLENFAFTFTEDTPLDVEIAIDPEMPGNLFESFALRLENVQPGDCRKQTGSYYTPRPLVHFMCREALKEHLSIKADKTGPAVEKLAWLLSSPPADQLDDGDAKRLRELLTVKEAKSLRQAILDCRVCDPAVGSGAFLVGMLREMAGLVARLDVRIGGAEAITGNSYDYDLKRLIIETCLYGVDIQEQAARICRQRLWLSLVAACRTGINNISGLPSLSCRIARGDSLLGRERRVNFEEVFDEKGGFDIVITNPPYVLLQSLKTGGPFAEACKAEYRTARYKIDSYQLFYEAGHRLLSSRGVLAYISPNTFLRNKHAYGLRALLANHHAIRRLVIFSAKVFRGTGVDVCVLISRRQEKSDESNMIDVSVVESKYPGIEDLLNSSKVPQSRVRSHPRFEFDVPTGRVASGWITRLESIKERLGDYVEAYFGIQTFDRSAYVSDNRIGGNWKPCIDGRNVGRYVLAPPREYVMFEKEAIKSGGKMSVYETDRIVVRQIGKTPVATLCAGGIYSLNTLYNIYPKQGVHADIEAILAVLNSKLLQQYWEARYFDHKTTFPKIKKEFLLEMPFVPDAATDSELSRLAGEVIKRKSENQETGEIEDRIDRIVYSRYGISKE